MDPLPDEAEELPAGLIGLAGLLGLFLAAALLANLDSFSDRTAGWLLLAFAVVGPIGPGLLCSGRDFRSKAYCVGGGAFAVSAGLVVFYWFWQIHETDIGAAGKSPGGLWVALAFAGLGFVGLAVAWAIGYGLRGGDRGPG